MSASGMHARNGKARTPFWRVSASNKKGLARLQMVSALSGMSGGAGGMRRPAVCMGWLQRGVYPPIDILLHFACIWTSYLTLFALRNFFYITFFPSHKILSPYHPYLLWGTSEMKSFPTETLFFLGVFIEGRWDDLSTQMLLVAICRTAGPSAHLPKCPSNYHFFPFTYLIT